LALAGGELNAAIARRVVGIYLKYAGRGPTKARALFRDNVLVVILEGVMTTAERSLAAAGREHALGVFHEGLRAAMEAELIAAVEELTGSGVSALLADAHTDPDIGVELFILDRPIEPGGGRGRAVG
jgi:uncharacterized protein YbcI